MKRNKLNKTILYLFLSMTPCLLGGCLKDSDEIKSYVAEDEGEYTIFYPGKDKDKIYSYVYKSDVKDDNELVDELIDELKKGDYNGSKDPVISKELSDFSYYINSKGIVTIRFSSIYQNLEGIDEVLFRACVVKTLCQSDNIKGVEFYVDDSPLVISDGKVVLMQNNLENDNNADNNIDSEINTQEPVKVGVMNQYDFVNNISNKEVNEQKDILALYYANEDGDKLETAFVSVTYDDQISREELIVTQLIQDPVIDECYRAINEDTKINKILVKNKICYLDLSAQFLDFPQGVTKEVAVYSIVNSLVDIDTVTNVQILIDGEVLTDYSEDGLMDRNLDIISKEE